MIEPILGGRRKTPHPPARHGSVGAVAAQPNHFSGIGGQGDVSVPGLRKILESAMRYAEFEAEIKRMAASATDSARLRFALDTIRLLRRKTDAVVKVELTKPERQLVSAMLLAIDRKDYDLAGDQLDQLTKSMCADDVRAIEFHPDVTELMCAIDNLCKYASSHDSQWIARVAINMVNSVDYAVEGVCDGYSIDDMMVAKEMSDEYQRQRRLLMGT